MGRPFCFRIWLGFALAAVTFFGNPSKARTIQACHDLFGGPSALVEPVPIMNTERLLHYVENGGPPRDRLHPAWSSFKVLWRVLGLRGPLGPAGPLGEAGPVGDHTWNPSFWWSKFLERDVWEYAPDALFDWAGPLSDKGPLGDDGPLAMDWGEGAYSILGTTGPLGPLGLLGPLGPMGAVQSKDIVGPDENGVYYDARSGGVVGAVDIQTDHGTLLYDIFEHYAPQYAEQLSREGKLVSGFAVDSFLGLWQTQRSYRILIPRDQVLAVVVSPERGMMMNALGLAQKLNFDLEVRDRNGRVLMDSKKPFHVNFTQLAVSAGTRLEIVIRRQGLSLREQHFRLFVLGADRRHFDFFPDITRSNREIDPYEQFAEFLREHHQKRRTRAD